MGWFSKPKVPDYKPLAEANRYAADQQYKASQEAIGQWKSMYEQVRDDTMPWRDAGLSALEEIQTGIESGAFEDDFSSPDVDFDKWSPEDYTRLTRIYPNGRQKITARLTRISRDTNAPIPRCQNGSRPMRTI